VKQPPTHLVSLANAKIAEDDVENVFDIDSAGQPAQGSPGEPQFLRHHILARRQSLADGTVQGCEHILQRVAVPCASHQCRFAGAEELLGTSPKRPEKAIESRFS
jgi:hypothetical protein